MRCWIKLVNGSIMKTRKKINIKDLIDIIENIVSEIFKVRNEKCEKGWE